MKELARVFKDLGYLTRKVAELTESRLVKLKTYNDAAIYYQYVLTMINERIDGSGEDEAYRREIEEIFKSLDEIRGAVISTIEASGIIHPHTRAEAEENKVILKSLREKSKNSLEWIEGYKAKIKEAREAGCYEKEVEYRTKYIELSEELFKEITEQMKGFLAKLCREAEEELGVPPCEYSVLGLGSMALQQMTPYSDLEFAILTANEAYKTDVNPKARDYFKYLTHLVNFKVIQLGESIIPTSRYGVDLSHLVHRGVNLDLGGKTPLGRIEEDKPYDLVQTIEGMLRYVRDEVIEEGRTASNIDKRLPHILEQSVHVHGEEAIYRAYVTRIEEFR